MTLPPAAALDVPSDDASQAAARQRFLLAGRRVLQMPSQAQAHAERIDAALQLRGAEPLQGTLADLFWGCRFELPHISAALMTPAVATRLPPHARQAFASAARSRRVERITPLATRWSVLTTPSIDVPPRAMRCGADDSRRLADAAVAAARAGDAQAEAAFLAHCTGAHDTLAFMLAQRELRRAGFDLNQNWDCALHTLQREAV